MEYQSEGLARMYRDLGEALSGLADAQFTGTSEDGYVTVTANVEGIPVDIELNPRIRRLDSDDMKVSLMQAITAARDVARAGKDEALRSVFGPEFSSEPSPSESAMDHTSSMIKMVGRHARQKYLGDSQGGGQ